MRVTYTQDWAAYNAAQCSEKERFLPLLADLCATIQNPRQEGRGRPRLPMSDMAYAAVAKVYVVCRLVASTPTFARLKTAG